MHYSYKLNCDIHKSKNHRGGSRGRVQGVRTPPPPHWYSAKKTMWFIGVEVEQETSAPHPKKILDPPLNQQTYLGKMKLRHSNFLFLTLTVLVLILKHCY